MSKRNFTNQTKKVFHSAAVLTLLLPNIMSVGLVAAEEVDPKNPAVETVVPAQEADAVQEPREVSVRVTVRTPSNMENYANTLSDFTNYPLILTNQVTGETFNTSILQSDNNTSNHFTFDATVLSYDRGYPAENYYDISLPQELIDLGYSLTREHTVRSNNGIVGTTSLSYNAPAAAEETLELTKRTDYSYLEGRDIQFVLTSDDGLRTYQLGNRNLAIPAGTYDLRVTNLPVNQTRPELMYRESTLTHSAERQIELTQDGSDYVGAVTLDYPLGNTAQVFHIHPVEIPEEVVHTVRIDPNGGTIDEDKAVTEVNDGGTYTLPYNFQTNLARPGYTLTGYSVEGTLLDVDGNTVSDISKNTNTYTPMSEVTLSADWAITSGGVRIQLYDDNPAAQPDNYTVTLVAEDGTEYALARRSYNNLYGSWRVDNVPNGEYTLVIDGFNIAEGEKSGQPDTTSEFTVNEDGSASLDLGFVDDKSTTFIRYNVFGEPVSDSNTVTIDPNGGTMTEDYTTTEIVEGEAYTLPYRHTLNLVNPGYTLTGYSVEGTLLDADGQEVTEVSRFTGDYTPVTDVTLTALWEVTAGGLRIQDHTENFRTADRSFVLTDGENEYPLTSNRYTNSYREWRVDDIPNGVYTLLVDGIAHPGEWNLDTTSTNSSATIADDGTVTVDLTFADNSSTTFVRFALTMNEYDVGVEVRGLDGKRTADVGVHIEDTEGTVFEGTFDQYNLWTTNDAILPGLYTVTLTTPEGTYAEINSTVASQVAKPTDTENVFTLEVNATSKGNLSRVFGAFQLVEIEEPAPETDADRHEPVFVDKIVLDLNRGNGKLKNPKTYIQNMNEMPGGFKVTYTNLDSLDLTGKTTETQYVEITTTYRDGSSDVTEVPLQVISKEKPNKSGVGRIIREVVRVVKSVVTILSTLFGRFF